MAAAMQRLFHSMPRRRLARLASVVPASPTNTSSESRSSSHSASELCRPGIASVRTPSSQPLARDQARHRLSAASPVFGSTVVVVPRASLLWKPRPALTKNSVLLHRPEDQRQLGRDLRVARLGRSWPQRAGCRRRSATGRRARRRRCATTVSLQRASAPYTPSQRLAHRVVARGRRDAAVPRCRTGRRECGRGAAAAPTSLRASRPAERCGSKAMAGAQAVDAAAVALLELVAVGRASRQ